jgi:predicted HicB family RNase H-like nuclease
MNKSKTVIIRVEPELKTKLIAEADELGITLSEYIRRRITGSVEWDTGKITFKRE